MLEKSPRRHAAIFAIVLILLVPLLESPTRASAASPTAGVIVPLYTASASQWDSVIQAKVAHPAVPIVGIINPADGPGSIPNATYASLTQKLQSAGVVVLGYVYTSYGSRNSSAVQSDVNDYATWYKVKGIFFDQMAYWSGVESYYNSMTVYAKSIGLTLVVGNSGVDTLPSYVGTVDTIVIYESAGFPNPASLGGWHTNYAKTNWAILPYYVDSLGKACVDSASNYVGYLYVTNGASPHPWASLPSYFPDLVASLDSAPTNVCLTTQSGASNGSPISGLWVTIGAGGSTVATGFTPLTFAAAPGTQYTVSVSDYQNYAFYYWSDTGSTDRLRLISIQSDNTITAVYFNYAGPPPSGYSKISLATVNSANASLSGFYTTFWSSTSILQGCLSPCSVSQGLLYSCFSPCAYFVANGATYYVAVADYGSETFSHWGDGTTARYHAVVIGNSSLAVNLVAVYSP